MYHQLMVKWLGTNTVLSFLFPIWVNSGSWWWTGRPGMLQFMRPQRIGHNWATELNWWLKNFTLCFVVVQSLNHIWLFATSWTAAQQASLSFTISLSLLKLMFIESVMPSNHLILCHPLFLLPSIFPSIRVFSKESALCIRWQKYWSFSFSISTSNDYSEWSPLVLTGLISLQFKGFSRVFSSTTVQMHQFIRFFICFSRLLASFLLT